MEIMHPCSVQVSLAITEHTPKESDDYTSKSYNKPMVQEDVLATSPPTTGPLQTVNPVKSQFILTNY